ncbi:MAG: hypothetical protein A2445_01725 [Candidatus Jacksonbacteria bacterium RIFOXYC2_FULL_44_29]|nr:MAG: CDP-alcohol phosphatidyltransferase [Parcubacteria group bacterium GW2011_GWC2_44_22]OGY75576.1 MAG: hypothetical protein A2295_05150 [Candidatus Jacksonbacteria bacterium RIFOXYB2_FULL_44_15]OGY75670.1 MAG: hypothetical protein A2240_03925 [Candidatus Jacksonbacteria bacterium RIFOXYA2_FULL_43_12]OGY77564.1 MAG: hypothetical protein A2445_01725 [Candidatus Jacksonbacteria bacterium RIFOXYC2_FULL_44_29]OGY81764.1 MAG: hypothetical protein A2550_01175 [Candidatus Jacksonbacteria bacteriu
MEEKKSKTAFRGAEKTGTWLLAKWEQKIIRYLIPKFPSWIETYHLTLMTLIWSGLIILFGYLAQTNINWLWGASLAIVAHWFTDSFDGALGRYRGTGLVRWGYYMDHFLDYLFFCSILISYALTSSGRSTYLLLFIMAIFGAYMVNAFLSFKVTDEFKIGFFRVGPTEIRIVFIIINTLIIFNKTYFKIALPYILFFSFAVLCLVVYRTQKKIWQIDMRNKKISTQ